MLKFGTPTIPLPLAIKKMYCSTVYDLLMKYQMGNRKWEPQVPVVEWPSEQQ